MNPDSPQRHILPRLRAASDSQRPESRPAPSAPSPARRWVYLDVLRAVAILLVLVAHMPLRMPENTIAFHAISAWHYMGWVGVDLFFVLSGFLIGGLLFTEQSRFGKVAYGRFLWRRALKIWPAYLVFIAAAAVWDVSDGEGPLSSRIADTAGRTWPYLIHIQNYYAPLVERIGHAWSLAVEEHFYLLLPAVLIAITWCARRFRTGASLRPFPGLRWVFAAVALGCLAIRLVLWRLHPDFDEFVHHWPTHLRMDSLFAGVMLAYAVQYARREVEALRRHRTLILIASVICFAPFALPLYHYDSKFTSTFGYSLLALGSAGLVLCAWMASEPATQDVTVEPGVVAVTLARIGACSYSIYLWHMPFTVPILTRLGAKLATATHLWGSPVYYPVMLALYFALSILLGAVMYQVVERPVLAMRERFFPSTAALARRAQQSATADEPEADPLLAPTPAVAEWRAAG